MYMRQGNREADKEIYICGWRGIEKEKKVERVRERGREKYIKRQREKKEEIWRNIQRDKDLAYGGLLSYCAGA